MCVCVCVGVYSKTNSNQKKNNNKNIEKKKKVRERERERRENGRVTQPRRRALRSSVPLDFSRQRNAEPVGRACVVLLSAGLSD